jgi:hypothetical protein
MQSFNGFHFNSFLINLFTSLSLIFKMKILIAKNALRLKLSPRILHLNNVLIYEIVANIKSYPFTNLFLAIKGCF